MQNLTDTICGAILAGGKSSRFGTNKAFAQIDGICMIERVEKVLSSLFRKVIIIADASEQYEYLGHEVFQDVIKGRGPLGGILTALSVTDAKTVFAVACDMPFINKDLVNYMCSLQEDSIDAVLPLIKGKPEPLFALYSAGCLKFIKNALSEGNLKITDFVSFIKVRYVEEDEICKFDPEFNSFININRQIDIKRMVS